MENIVPGALQRLRAADIVRMAGLTTASRGQEYCRSSVVHSPQRQGARIMGVVELPRSSSVGTLSDAEGSADNSDTPSTIASVELPRYLVEVEIQNPTTWISSCSCNASTPLLCVHAAILLYQWLAHPEAFTPSTKSQSSPVFVPPAPKEPEMSGRVKPTYTFARVAQKLVQRGPAPISRVMDVLTQLGLNELRGIAREYEITTNGMGKQQIAEAILAAMRQPEAVRHVAASLEKAQRQLLAALALAGGSMTDEDLRGLFERFALGQPGQFQNVISVLQSKALLFRTALNASQRSSLSGALPDLGWYVPSEVCTALRVTVPVTPFDPQQEGMSIRQAEPYSLLADLLLVARVLNGYQLTQSDEWYEARSNSTVMRHADAPASNGSIALPAPASLPSAALLSKLHEFVPRPLDFLRFAVQLLKLADILYKDDNGSAYLRALPNAPQLFLGPGHGEVLRDLFELWLTQSSYTELFALQEKGVRLRCRATVLNVPVLRVGELDSENGEARQMLVSLLAQVPLKQWVSFSAFARFVYRLNPLFLQKRQRLFPAPHWWMEHEEGHPLRPMQLNDWLQGEFHYLAYLLTGPLHWWGICDIACSRDGRLQAFYLTPLAGMLFGRSPLDEEEAETPVYQTSSDILEIISTEEAVVTCSPHAWPIIELLETFTESAGVRAGRLRYRFTPKALAEAVGRGHNPASLLTLLQSTHIASADASSEPSASLSSSILARLERWISGYGRARIYPGVTLLETADAAVMRELIATTSLDKQIVCTVRPTLHLLRKSGVEAIIDDLKRRGQAPLLHDEDIYGAE